MFTLAAWCLLAIVPYQAAVTDHVEVIELNRFYDEHGNPVFLQSIFRDSDDAGFPIRDWRLVRDPLQQPYYDAERETYRLDWYDGTTLRSIRAKEVRHTWTQFDPETAARETLPVSERKGLSKPITKTAQQR